jgi:hypothetical protein
VDSLKGIPRSQAIEKLFGIKLTKHIKFKGKLTSLEENGALKFYKKDKSGAVGSRGKIYYLPEQLTLLHNVVLISAIYPQPSVVLEIIVDSHKRKECADEIEGLLNGRKEIGEIYLYPDRLASFFEGLQSDVSLDSFKLVNPFVSLPQTIPHKVDGYLSVLAAFHLPEVVALDFERMMAYFFNLEIAEAFELSLMLSNVTSEQMKYVNLVQSSYNEAKDFDEVFESFLD